MPCRSHSRLSLPKAELSTRITAADSIYLEVVNLSFPEPESAHSVKPFQYTYILTVMYDSYTVMIYF